MENHFQIADKVVAITGGAGVLCGEMAKACIANGAKVAILDLNLEAGEKMVAEMGSVPHKPIVLRCNVLDKDSIKEAYDAVVKQLGKVDILINGAGGNKKEATTKPDLSFFDLPVDALKFVFDLNFTSTFLVTQVFAKGMVDCGEGVILNVSSMNSFRPLTNIPAYSAAKAAISNFTQWLAVHMCQNYSSRIRVNAIAPGFFLTEQNRFLLTDQNSGELTPRGQTIVGHTPMGRFGKPSDLLGTMLWLISDASAFVTGTVIPVDGGFSSFSGV